MSQNNNNAKIAELQSAARAALTALEGQAKTLRARSPAEAKLWEDERTRVVKQLKAAVKE